MKKIRINNILLFILGQFLLSLGVVMAVKTNFGVTVSTSPAFVLSQYITSIPFGTFNYLSQGIVFILMVIILLISIATTLSFIFFGKLIGVNVGTLLSTIAIGPYIGFCLTLFDRVFIVSNLSLRNKTESNCPPQELQ